MSAKELMRTWYVAKLPSTRESSRGDIQPVWGVYPCSIKELGALYCVPRIQEVLVLHDERAVISKLMFQEIEGSQPLLCPLLASVTPPPSPFPFSPRITDLQESLALVSSRTENTVSMGTDESYQKSQLWSEFILRQGIRPLVVVWSVAMPSPASESR